MERGKVRTLRGSQPTLIYARDKSGELAACVAVGSDDESAALTLKPAATALGRVVDDKGQP